MVHNQLDPDRISIQNEINYENSLLHCSIETTNLNSDPVPVLRENKSCAGSVVGGIEKSLLIGSFLT